MFKDGTWKGWAGEYVTAICERMRGFAESCGIDEQCPVFKFMESNEGEIQEVL